MKFKFEFMEALSLLVGRCPYNLFPRIVLRPCIIIEGYGKVHPRAFTYISPSGFKHEVEENYFDAFVTFIHAKTQYTGPGTEGFFYRDFISTNHPPHPERALT
jgi:hypothetical protein